MRKYKTVEDLLEGENFFHRLVSSEDSRRIQDQIAENYPYGFGWEPLEGFKLLSPVTGAVLHPDGHLFEPIATAPHGDQIMFLYKYLYIGLLESDGTFEMGRDD